MKATGIVRPIDTLGRIVLPKEIRDVLDIAPKDPIEIFTDGDTIVLKKYAPTCVFCQNADNITYYKGKMICRNCITALGGLIE